MSSDRAATAGIIVVGSANQNYVVRVPEPARPGETFLTTDLLKQPAAAIGVAPFITSGKVETWHRDPAFLFQPGGGRSPTWARTTSRPW